VMDDGTTLRFEALVHDLERELPMLVPIIVSVTSLSAPNVRIGVTRSKTVWPEIQRSRARRRLTDGR
jgi:hypothetical protein